MSTIDVNSSLSIEEQLEGPKEKTKKEIAEENRQRKIANSYPRVVNKFNAEVTFEEIFKECTRQNNRLQKWRDIMLDRGLADSTAIEEEFPRVLESGRLHKQAQRRMKKYNHFAEMNLEHLRRGLPPNPEMGPEARQVLKYEIILTCWKVYEIYCGLYETLVDTAPDGKNWNDEFRDFEYEPDA